MNTYKLIFLWIFSFAASAGQWSVAIQNSETETNSVLQATRNDFYFPNRSNDQWFCLLSKEKKIINNKGIPSLSRILLCATNYGRHVGGTMICENLQFETKNGDNSHLLMPEPCVDELELYQMPFAFQANKQVYTRQLEFSSKENSSAISINDLGGDALNIKIVVKYEWWK